MVNDMVTDGTFDTASPTKDIKLRVDQPREGSSTATSNYSKIVIKPGNI